MDGMATVTASDRARGIAAGRSRPPTATAATGPGPSGTGTRRLRAVLPPVRTSPRAARVVLAGACEAWAAQDFLDAGSLVISELVSNAVVHTGLEVEVELRMADHRLLMRVHDGAPAMPRIVPPEQQSLGGRGLGIVAVLAEAWGVAADPGGGKSVWCVLRGHEDGPEPGEGTEGSPANRPTPCELAQ